MTTAISRIRLIASLLLAIPFALSAIGPLSAMEPPRRGEVQKLRSDGSFPERLRKADRIGNHKIRKDLVGRFSRRNMLQGTQTQMAPPSNWQGGLPATGTPKVLVLLVDFAEYPANASNSPSYVANQMFGTGTTSNAPYESLTSFYSRSSYNQLNIQGNVLGWYRAQYSRSHYKALGDGRGNEALMKEALLYYNTAGHDFSQYDNDGNGSIDALYVKWTGPDEGWSSFWWAYQTSWYSSANVNVDGKRVGSYVWSWIANAAYDGQSVYTPRVDIHETGHLLGLPDYYDYDPNVGPDGGIGGLDMMDANWGDHNAFSKAMLGWLTPAVVSSGSLTKALQPSGTTGDAVLVMPNSSGNIFGEFFLAQYRKRGTGDDPASYPTDGLVVWHVDATLNGSGTDFLYNNSYSSRKLLKLMQADGLNQIEGASAYADAGDFYVSPKTLSQTSNPNSNKYDGSVSGVTINGLSSAGATMSATFSIGSSSTVSFGSASYSVSEGAGSITIPVVRSNAAAAASVSFATAGGTAASGSDFTAQSGVLNFAIGATTANIVVPITDDTTLESAENFSVSLSSPSTGTILAQPSSTTVTITDNDNSVTFRFGSSTYSVSEGTSSITIPVTRSSTAGSASVAYATSSGTATAGSDFTGASGRLNFSSGVSTQSIRIPISNDSLAEINETFTVNLSSPSAGTLVGSPGSATVTIVDNDSSLVNFSSPSYSVSEGTASVTITVTRSRTSGSASVSYATSSGSALAGSDFTSRSGTLTFASGVGSASFSVPIINDTSAESSESFTVSLSNPSSGLLLGATTLATVTIADNDGTAISSLQNGVSLGGLSGAKASQRYFSINVPAGATNLKVATSGGTGDSDLYVRFGAVPTLSSYDCSPYTSTTNETCSTAAPAAGTYYILINGYTAYSGVTLTASYSTTAAGRSTETTSIAQLRASGMPRKPRS